MSFGRSSGSGVSQGPGGSGAGQRSQSVSSALSSLPLPSVESGSDLESDTVFGGGHSPVPRASSVGSTNTSNKYQNGFEAGHRSKSGSRSPAQSSVGKEYPPPAAPTFTLQTRDDNSSLNSSSISSLNESHNVTESDASVESSSSSEIKQLLVPEVEEKLTLVHSPKECVRGGEPYIAPPPPEASGSSLAVPVSSSSSSTRGSSSPGLMSPVNPISPPMSPPPLSTDESGGSGMKGRCQPQETELVPSSQRVELPAMAEVIVTWSPSPTNFTVSSNLWPVSNSFLAINLSRQSTIEAMFFPPAVIDDVT